MIGVLSDNKSARTRTSDQIRNDSILEAFQIGTGAGLCAVPRSARSRQRPTPTVNGLFRPILRLHRRRNLRFPTALAASRKIPSTGPRNRLRFGAIRPNKRSPNTHVPVVACRSAGIWTRGQSTAPGRPAAGGEPAIPAQRGTRLEATTDRAFLVSAGPPRSAIKEACLSCRACGRDFPRPNDGPERRSGNSARARHGYGAAADCPKLSPAVRRSGGGERSRRRVNDVAPRLQRAEQRPFADESFICQARALPPRCWGCRS